MATQTISYGTRTVVTWTPASLATGSNDFSAAVDNTSTKFIDAQVSGKITTGTSPTVSTSLTLYVYGEDGNGQYGAGVAGTDGGTAGAGELANIPILCVIPTDATSDHTYEYGPISIAALFGGTLPPKWGVGVLNSSGVALNGTAGNHVCSFIGIKMDVA